MLHWPPGGADVSRKYPGVIKERGKRSAKKDMIKALFEETCVTTGDKRLGLHPEGAGD